MRVLVAVLFLQLCFGTASAGGIFAPAATAISVDIRYKHFSGKGFLNDGQFNIGTAFLWNRTSNELVKLESISLVASPQNDPGVLQDTDIGALSAADVSVVPSKLLGAKAKIGLELGRTTKLVAVASNREDHAKTYTGVSAKITEMKNEGGDPDRYFGIRDKNFNIVIVNSYIRADQLRFTIGGSDPTKDFSSNFEFSVNVPAIGKVRVSFTSNAFSSCKKNQHSTKSPGCIFDVDVINASYGECGTTPCYETLATDPAKLVEAFKKL